MKRRILVVILTISAALLLANSVHNEYSFRDANHARKYFREIIPQTKQRTNPELPDWFFGSSTKADFQTSKLLQTNSREVIDIKLNGQDQTTIIQGDEITVTVYFSDDCDTAELTIWADMNGNGIWEPGIDLLLPETSIIIIDNDLEDEDPASGIYQITLEAEEGPQMVSDIGLFFVAEDDGGIDDAYLYVNPLNSDYSVSGSVSPAAANIIIMAYGDEGMSLCATDSNGDYQLFVAEQDYYMIFAFDPLGIYNGLFANTVYENVFINGHLTGFDFVFEEGNAWIEGVVTDENGSALEGMTVYFEYDGPASIWALTDENGYYSISVLEGEWDIYFSESEILPDYMIPPEVYIYVEEGATEVVNFTLYETDSTISGTVFFDDVPAVGFTLHAWNDIVGSSSAISQSNGGYILPVASEANAFNGYYVHVDIWDIPGAYVLEYYDNVYAGSTGLDFHIYTATGGLQGFIYDSVTLQPIDESWITAFDGYYYYGTGTSDDGYYQLFLQNGTYDVWAEGTMYYLNFEEDIVIGDEMIDMDFYLDPIVFEGALQGMVYEDGTTIPIPGVELYVYSFNYWDFTTSDDSGFYYFDMPNGVFSLSTFHPLYYGTFIDDITINSNIVELDIEMLPVTFDGALEGYVFEDGTTDPIPFAQIDVYGNYSGTAMSDENGYYYLELPNGGYSAVCWKNGYFEATLDWFEINDDTFTHNFYLISMVDADDIMASDKASLSNYPNPFNPSTTITFSISSEEAQKAKLDIYNMKGQRIKAFNLSERIAHDGTSENQTGSAYSFIWDGRDDNNNQVSTGIYLCRLKYGKGVQTRRMLLLK